jgi:hypothetical protein
LQYEAGTEVFDRTVQRVESGRGIVLLEPSVGIEVHDLPADPEARPPDSPDGLLERRPALEAVCDAVVEPREIVAAEELHMHVHRAHEARVPDRVLAPDAEMAAAGDLRAILGGSGHDR